MPAPLLARLRPAHRFLHAAAWFFIVVSLLHMAFALVFLADGSPGTVKLYSTVVGEESFDAMALTYTGWTGLAQAVIQTLVVIAAATASCLRPATPRARKYRRVGHGVLTAWAGWWLLELLRLTAIDGQVDSMMQTGLMTVLFGATAYRAACGWSPARADIGPPPPDCMDPAPESPDDSTDTPVHPEYPASPTRQLFAAIAPPTPAVQPEPSPSPVARARSRMQAHFNRDALLVWRDKANAGAKKARTFVVDNSRRVALRAKPVARTAWRESKNAWRKTIDALKESERSTNHVA